VQDAAGYLYLTLQRDSNHPERGGEIIKIAPNEDHDVELFAYGFRKPWGLALDPSGNLYVTDRSSGEVYRFIAPPSPTVDFVPAATNQRTIVVQGQTQPNTRVSVDGGARRVHVRSDVSGRFALEVPLRPNALNRLLIYATGDDDDGLNSVPVRRDVVEDEVPPQITATLEPPANVYGWNNRDVTVSFTCADDRSGVASCPPATFVTAEGQDEAQRVTATATDQAGNQATIVVQVRIDRTPPSGVGVLSPPANANGWNNRVPVAITFFCADNLSGVIDCPAPTTRAAEGIQTLSVPITDRADNHGTALATVKIDLTAPQINFTVRDGTLFYDSPAQVRGATTDNLSGVVAVNCNQSAAAFDGATHTFTCDVPLAIGANPIQGWAFDAAGNVGTARETLVLGPRLPNGDDHQVLVSGDLNGDRNVDVVHTNFLTGDISILLGKGDGTFQPERRLAVGPYPSSVAIADIDGDGVLDIVTTHYTTGEVAIFRGRGDGNFDALRRFAAGDFPSSVAAADMDGNGSVDIVTAHMNSNEVHVHLAQPDRSFITQAPIGVGVGPVALAVGKLDGDQQRDIVTANFNSNDVSVILSAGNGAFQPERRVGAGAAPSAIAMADVGSDGTVDVVTVNSGANTVSLLRGRGDGSFDPEQHFAVGNQPGAVSIADVTGDGRLDVVTANFASSDLSVLRAQGSGLAPEERVSTNSPPASLTVIDVGGHPALVSANNVVPAQVIVGDGSSGGFTPVIDVLAAMNAPYVRYLPVVIGTTAYDATHRIQIRLENPAHEDNEVTMTFVDSASGRGVAQFTGVISTESAVTVSAALTPPGGFHGSGPPSNFEGAVIVSAKRPVTATGGVLGTTNSNGDYEAASVGSSRVTVPTVTKNISSFQSWLGVQNLGQQSTTVFVDFVGTTQGLHARTPSVVLGPGQSHVVRVEKWVIEDASGGFLGYATVNGDNSMPLAVTSIQEKSEGGRRSHLRAFNGIGDHETAPVVHIPLVMSYDDRNFVPGKFGLNFTELEIVNTGTEPTQIQIEYGANIAHRQLSELGACPKPDTQTMTLNAGAGLRVAHINLFPSPCKYVGSATIRSLAQQPLAVVVLEHNNIETAIYEGVTGAAGELYAPEIEANFTGEGHYTELQIQNTGSQSTRVNVKYLPNRLGGATPHEDVYFIPAGAAIKATQDGPGFEMEYSGSATLRSDNGMPIAAVVTRLRHMRNDEEDRVTAYRVEPKPMTAAAIIPLTLSDLKVTPAFGPCGAYAGILRSVRDGNSARNLFIDPNVLNPAGPFGSSDCLETEDQEFKQKAYAQGLNCTRDLPAFMAMDPFPTFAPLPCLTLNLNDQWGIFGANNSRGTLATTYPSRGLRGSAGDPWSQILKAAAQATALAAAAKAGRDLGDEMSKQLHDIDWYRGPAQYPNTGRGPLEQFGELQRSLEGAGSVSAGGEDQELPQLFRDIARFINEGEATTGNPPPDPDANCRTGQLDPNNLGVADDFVSLVLDFTALTSTGTGTLFIHEMKPQSNGVVRMCSILRKVATCMRGRGMTSLLLFGRRNLPPDGIQFMDYYFGVGNGEAWSFDLNDTTQPGAGCLF
jgi:hypothetical protein